MEGDTTWDRLGWAHHEVISTDVAAANQGDTTWDRLGWAHDEVISADGAARGWREIPHGTAPGWACDDVISICPQSVSHSQSLH